MQTLGGSVEVGGKVGKLRYFVVTDLPDFSQLVVGCPISTFTILAHSQRKVKEIDLNEWSLPKYLDFMKPVLSEELPNFNHILINHYPPGIGIMPQ